MSVQTDSCALHTTGSTQDADTAALDRLEQEVVELDALILAAVRRRSDLARSIDAAGPAPAPVSRFADLGADGSAFDRMLDRLSARVAS